MNNEQPAELQVLVQLLGPDMGRMVHAVATMAASCVQLNQQIQLQAAEIQQLRSAPPPPASAPEPGANPWTEPHQEAP